MKKILVTPRVDVLIERNERRDALDQRWSDLLLAADLLAVQACNSRAWAQRWLVDNPLDGLLLTGGNSLADHGGDAPERDETERLLLAAALEKGVPVLGVCRGMQLVLDHFGGTLQNVQGHVAARQQIRVHGQPALVNSYHDLGTFDVPATLEVWAQAEDGVIKAIRHRQLPVWGIMWHPERMAPYRNEDLQLLRHIFGEGEDS